MWSTNRKKRKTSKVTTNEVKKQIILMLCDER